MVRTVMVVSCLLMFHGVSHAQAIFRVYNKSDVEVNVKITHATSNVFWREQLEVGGMKPTTIGAEKLDYGMRTVTVASAFSPNTVRASKTFEAKAGEAYRIDITGVNPNLMIAVNLTSYKIQK